jgi:hypothetical protein
MFSVMLRACLVRGLSAIRNFPGPTLTTQERTERVLSSGITAAPPTEWLEGLMPQAVRKTARTDPQAAPLHESVRISTSESLPNVL